MKKVLPALLVALAVFYVIVAVYYWVTPASSLPTFMPGYQADYNQPHFKHGLASLVLAVACGILAWFLTGKKPSAPSNGPTPPNAE